MSQPSEAFTLATCNLSLDASIVPWDSAVYGFPIASISQFQVNNPEAATQEYAGFEAWLRAHDCRMVSCRMAHERLRESIFLEDFGFRFIEMVLHPVLGNLGGLAIEDQGLDVAPAGEADLDSILTIAKSAFTNERFYIDPRLPSECSHQRYGRWASSAFGHARQRLLKIQDGDALVGFFVVEEDESQHAYWHLTAVSPNHHGKGYGYRTWLSVLKYHQEKGIKKVSTTISARNSAVLGLYSKLNFRFLPPEMTFHWVRN